MVLKYHPATLALCAAMTLWGAAPGVTTRVSDVTGLDGGLSIPATAIAVYEFPVTGD